MKSLGLPEKFSGRGDVLLDYYCKLRERYPVRGSMSILRDRSVDCNIDCDTPLRDEKHDPGFYVNKWANRGVSVVMQCGMFSERAARRGRHSVYRNAHARVACSEV